MRLIECSLHHGPVLVQRPGPLVIWADTSFFVNLRSERCDARVQDAAAAISKAVHAGKALLVEGQEDEEVYDERHADFDRERSKLSLGCRFRHWDDIHLVELRQAARAFAGTVDCIVVPAASVFQSDCFGLSERSLRFVVRAMGNPEVRRREIEARVPSAAEWERQRVDHLARQVGFEELFEPNLRGAAAIRYRWMDQRNWTDVGDLAEARAVRAELEAIGHPIGLDHTAFRDSSLILAQPSAYVYATLVADLISGEEHVGRSDVFDAQHLRVAVPYADVVITDARMRERIRRKRLDRRFSCDAYSMKQLADLTARLSKLLEG